MARFGCDDGYALGPPDIVFPALERFATSLRELCLLEWERSKTEVFLWDGPLPDSTSEGLQMAGATVNGVFERGFLCYGVPIGTDAYVKHVLYQKAKEITDGAERASEVLAGDRQALWAVLKWSISQQFDYWLQLVYPSLVREAASMIDNVLWRVMETAAGGQIPRTDEGKGWECVIDPPIDSLRGRSFQEWVVRQPVKMGGMGLRSLADLSPAAYIGAVEQAVPCFTGIRGVCPVLSNVVGVRTVLPERLQQIAGGGSCSSLAVGCDRSSSRYGT